MIRFLLSVCLVAILMVSCKKEDAAVVTGCETSIAGITGDYKLTKWVSIDTTSTVDITSSQLDACQLSAIYKLKSDKTVTYTETGASCAGTDIGTWNAGNGVITLAAGPFEVIGCAIVNNCTTLVITKYITAAKSYVFTLTKQ